MLDLLIDLYLLLAKNMVKIIHPLLKDLEKVVGSFTVDRKKTEAHISDIVNILSALKDKNLLPP